MDNQLPRFEQIERPNADSERNNAAAPDSDLAPLKPDTSAEPPRMRFAAGQTGKKPKRKTKKFPSLSSFVFFFFLFSPYGKTRCQRWRKRWWGGLRNQNGDVSWQQSSECLGKHVGGNQKPKHTHTKHADGPATRRGALGPGRGTFRRGLHV